MRSTSAVMVLCVLSLFCHFGPAKAVGSVEDQIAALKKENAALKEQNAELIGRLNAITQSKVTSSSDNTATKQRGSNTLAPSSVTPVAKATDDKPDTARIYNWTGWYAGANIGYSWGSTDSRIYDTTDPVSFIPSSQKLHSLTTGGQFGHNWQIDNNLVMGLETDLQYSYGKGSTSITIPNADPFFGTVIHKIQTRIGWFGTVRGRAGVLLTPTTLLYATGGVAYANIGAKGTGTFPNFAGFNVLYRFNDTGSIKFGSAVGGGVEGAVPNTSNWTWKAEYLYLDFRNAGLNGEAHNGFSSFILSNWSVKFVDNVARVGFNYHFH